MRVISEMSLTNFEFWAGAKANAEMLTYEELEQIGEVIEELYEEIEDVTINDIFWFDFAWCCECVGIKYDEEEDIIIREEESEE
jgi:hypothetical protein